MAISMDLKVSAFGKAYSSNQKKLQNDVNAAQSFFGLMQNTAAEYSVDEAGRSSLLTTYNQLTENSREILHRMKNQEYISKEDWGILGKDLLAVGAISQDDYFMTSVSPQLIPLPSKGEPKIASILAPRLMGYLNGDDITGWNGNLQDYLEQWRAQLRELGMTKAEDGSLAYKSSTIDKFVSATENVQKVISELLSLI